MADVIYPNLTLNTANDISNAVWKLTRAMKKAGWTYKCSSDASTNDITGVATSDTWGGSADPSSDTYPSLGTGAWWGAQGPTTVKIPIGSSVPSGSGFLRGEKVSQATSGAEAEIIGAVVDSGGGNGYLVLVLRTGSFDGTHVITGASSTSTVTPSATPIVYIRNVVFWRQNSTAGHIYYQTIDVSGEASSNLFSAARLAAITNSICPGGDSGGANTFPSVGTFVVQGTGGSGSVSSGSKTWTNSNISTYGLAQVIAANATPSSSVSPDGTFSMYLGTPGIGAGSYVGFAFLRCDDVEDGDVDPFIWFSPDSNAPFSNNRTSSNTVISNTTRNVNGDFFGGGLAVCALDFQASSSGVSFRGWRRRGFGSGDAYQDFVGASLASENIGGDSNFSAGYNSLLEQSSGTPETAATVLTTLKIREPIWIVSYQNASKMRKGTLRWWFLVQGGNGNDTYDTKRYFQVSATSRKPVIAGPWDGTTVPSNQ